MQAKRAPTIEEIRHKTVPILKKYGATRAGVFGSTARGTHVRRDSDIDILVEIPNPIGLFAFVALKQDLEHALGRKVDLVEYDTIKTRIRERVLAEEVMIHDARSSAIL